MKVHMEEQKLTRIAYFRNIGPYGPENLQLMKKLKIWAKEEKLLIKGAQILGIPQDNPEVTPGEKCRFDCAIHLPEDFQVKDDVANTTLPGGKYAVLEVDHTPGAILQGWVDLFDKWLPESGFQIDNRPVFERYTGSGDQVSDEPSKCEICIPVCPL